MSWEQPREGFYLGRLVRDGPFVPIKIWWGPTPDPDHPENPMDRSSHWQALRNGKPVAIERVWPWCAKNEITKSDYEYRLAAVVWDREYDPASAGANPTKAVDLNTAKPLF